MAEGAKKLLDLIQREFIVTIPLSTARKHLAQVEPWPTWVRHINYVELQPMHLTVGNGAGASGQLFSVVVEVQPASGPAYTAQAKIAVSQASLDKYQPGALVNVKVDPRDPQVLVFEVRR